MINSFQSKRWVVLQHTLSQKSMEGLHFDLLLEDQGFCRTWRLPEVPLVDGPLVEAIPLNPHGLHWLERKESVVSGGRGWAKRILIGNFFGSLPLEIDGFVSIDLISSNLNGQLRLENNSCQIFSF